AQPPTRRGPQPAPAGPLPARGSGPLPNPTCGSGAGAPASRNQPRPGQDAVSNPLPAVLGLGAILVAIVAFAVGLRRMQRNAGRFDGRSAMARPAAPETQAPPSRAPAPSWTATHLHPAPDVR